MGLCRGVLFGLFIKRILGVRVQLIYPYKPQFPFHVPCSFPCDSPSSGLFRKMLGPFLNPGFIATPIALNLSQEGLHRPLTKLLEPSEAR